MQYVSTYNSHLQAKLRTVIALQDGYAHLGSHNAYSVLLRFFIHNVTYIYYAIYLMSIKNCPSFYTRVITLDT